MHWLPYQQNLEPDGNTDIGKFIDMCEKFKDNNPSELVMPVGGTDVPQHCLNYMGMLRTVLNVLVQQHNDITHTATQVRVQNFGKSFKAADFENNDNVLDFILRTANNPTNPDCNYIQIIKITRGYTLVKPKIESRAENQGWINSSFMQQLENFVMYKDKEHVHEWVKIYYDKDNNAIRVLTNQSLDPDKVPKLFIGLFYILLHPSLKDQITHWFNCEETWITEYLQTWYNDYESKAQERIFSNFEKAMQARNTSRIQQLENYVKNAEHDINSYYDAINSEQSKIRDYRMQILGYQTAPAKIDETAIQMLKNGKALRLIDCNSDNFTISIKTKLFNYNVSDVQMYYKHSNWTNTVTSNALTAYLFKEAFINRKYNLLVTQYIRVPMTSRTSWNSGRAIHDYNYKNEYPNPHIYHFNCYSSTTHEVGKALQEGNVTQALNQLIAAVGQITFTDTAVIRRMVNDFVIDGPWYECKCWENKETGEMMSAKEIWEQHVSEDDSIPF